MSDFWKDYWNEKINVSPKNGQAKRQKEEEVRALLQKDPDDLTGNEIKRLKELQSGPDLYIESFLTQKEYKKLLSIIGEPTNEGIEDEVRVILQKNPDDLTGKEIKRLKELQNDPNIDVEDFLTVKEYKKLLSIIGEPKKEEPSEMSLFGHPIQFDK